MQRMVKAEEKPGPGIITEPKPKPLPETFPEKQPERRELPDPTEKPGPERREIEQPQNRWVFGKYKKE